MDNPSIRAIARLTLMPPPPGSITGAAQRSLRSGTTSAALVDRSSAGFSVPAGDSDEVTTDDPADAEIVAQIRELIDTRVRPAVANDGGDIVYRGFDKGKVYLQMQGACSGCPSSSATLKNGIEQLLKYYVPEVTEVRAV